MRSYRIEANGLSLAVHDWGGEGQPVLLAHPTGFHGHLWAPIARRLIARGRRVYSFDFRGHGDSDAPDIDYSWHGFAADVLAVTRHLRLDGDPDLLACGHSKGGAALVLTEEEHPGTYARLWLYEPIIFPSEVALPPQEDFPLARAARRRRGEWASPAEAYAAYSSKPPLQVMEPESLHAYVDYGLRARSDGQFELKCRPEVEARVYTMGPNHGAYARLADVKCPVLLAYGSETDAIQRSLAARLAQRLPRATVEEWAQRGHFGPQEVPDRAVDSMLAFAAAS